MIGKSLRQRYALGALAPDLAVALVTEALPSQAPHLVKVRAQDPRMIACLVVRADDASVRFCRGLGFDVKRGGTFVFGLLGADAARLFRDLPAHQRAWLEGACGPRETKVFLIAGGTALLSLEVEGGNVRVTPLP
jgi:hypothetical protein